MSIVLRVALVAIASTVLTANAMAQKVRQNQLKPFTAAEQAYFDRASMQSNGGGGDSGGGGAN